MKEVSCSVLKIFLEEITRRGLSPDVLFYDLPYNLKHLQDSNKTIEWAAFVRFMHNVGAEWGDEGLEYLGSKLLACMAVPPVAQVAHFIFSLKDFYQWIMKCLRGGTAKEHFSCIRSQLLKVGAGQIDIRIEILRKYETCPEFFLVTKGLFREIPRVVGLNQAKVEMEQLHSHAVCYHIVYSTEGTLLLRLGKGITWLITRSVTEEYQGSESITTEPVQNNQTGNLQGLTHLQNARDQRFEDISEELRTSIKLILGALENLSVKAPEDQKIVLATLTRNAQRLSLLTDHLLDFSKLQAGTTQLLENHIQNTQRISFLRDITVEAREIKISSPDQKFLEKMLATIDSHLDDEHFSIEDFSHEAGYSRMQLYRKIKALAGQSPSQFVRAIRLKRAAQLLSNRTDSVTQIAYQVGFSSLAYFNKCFKDHYGMTPRRFSQVNRLET